MVAAHCTSLRKFAHIQLETSPSMKVWNIKGRITPSKPMDQFPALVIPTITMVHPKIRYAATPPAELNHIAFPNSSCHFVSTINATDTPRGKLPTPGNTY
ncbi:hypothetical protein V6N13_126033 [Hibiscus sabdariffa]